MSEGVYFTMRLVFTPIFVCVYVLLTAQELKVALQNVEARFVSIPNSIRQYQKGVEDYPTYAVVKLDKIWYPDRNYKEGFGDIYLQDSFAIFFTGQMQFPQDGWYEYSLNSDDGSLLWLNKKLVLHNGGGHKMRMRKDTSFVKAGTHDFKIWYFQDFPDRMGIEFDVKHLESLDKEIPEEQLLADSEEIVKTEPAPREEKIVLNAQVLFAFDSYNLSQKGREVLDSIGLRLAAIKNADFLIEGHTDNIGTEEYNQNLAYKRALAVQQRIALQSLDASSKMIIRSFGATRPVLDNASEKGRQENRRVEIKINYHESVGN